MTVQRQGGGRYVPLGYLALAVALAVVLLPTALRPPPDQQNSTASFSPDAPPDDPPEMLLQSLKQAQSSTAGAAEVAATAIEEAPPPPPPPPPRRLATRGRCFGTPPRQTESLYSALCIPAWTGADNGGKTAPGVYPNEIRLAIAVGLSSSTPEGRLAREFDSDDRDGEHDLKVWQTYFNERFEFYGRYLQFYVLKVSSTDEDQMRAAVQRAKREWDVFAMTGTGGLAAAAVEENVRQQIIDYGSINNPWDWYNAAFPYASSFWMDSDQALRLQTELACKHYVGKPPDLNERQDPLFDYSAPRVWGAILYQDPTRTGAADLYRSLLARCGGTIKEVQEYNLSTNQQGLAGIMGKMKAAGVTSLLLGVDGIAPAVFTAEAERIRYYPEYFHAGTGGIDGNGAGRLMEDNQVRHMVGIGPGEIARPDADKDWYRAYKEIDPDGDPDSTNFRSLQQLAGGFQMAGPNLTPVTFWDGLFKQPFRSPDPVWAMGGGYRQRVDFLSARDLTYVDFATLVWFDQSGKDPNSSLSGAWCHVYGGRRFEVGQIPTEPIPWRDTKQCITSPEKGVAG